MIISKAGNVRVTKIIGKTREKQNKIYNDMK